ncbi:MAG: capsular biosynthesis protein [Bacteroides sp.]|nr:capsular biosynthesis protein [Bacteroides sp.]
MWPFKSSVKSLEKSGLFDGFTDCHAHILPGVDDGIRTMEDALQVLQTYERLGVTKVWLTPHIMEDYPNSTADLKKRYEELKSAWKGKVEIRLAAENMLDSLFEERLEAGELLPIGDEGTHLLVETSYYTPPFNMDELLERIKSKGYYPILAHPERYRYMEEADYRRLKDMGVLFQMNFMSLVEAYGETAKGKAEWLLKNGMIDYLGSDIHRHDAFIKMIEKSPKKRDSLERMLQVKKTL